MKKTASLSIFVFVALSLFGQVPEITVDQIWNQRFFTPTGVQGYTALPDDNYYSIVSRNGIEKYDYAEGNHIGTIFEHKTLSELTNDSLSIRDIDEYAFDKTSTHLLLATRMESIYRRSSKAFYYVYDYAKGSLKPVADPQWGKQSFATFDCTGTKVAYVRNNNIFIKDFNNDEEVQVTTDGKERNILNGIADWVYEEELSMAQCFSWSPDGKKIAYLRFDESRVREFAMTLWGELYPSEYRYKYPKAGEDNSLVTVMIYDVVARTATQIPLGDNLNCYFPRIYWLNNSAELIVLKLNRHQNNLDFIRYNVATQQQDIVYSDTNRCWLEVSDDYFFLDDGKNMIVTSERNGYNHIYRVAFGGAVTPITAGNWEVASICAVDKQKKLIYYLSNESAVLNRDLYVIGFDGKNKKMLTNGKGWNQPTFNSSANYFRNQYSDINTPPVYSIQDTKGKVYRVLNDNQSLQKKMKEYQFSMPHFFRFTTPDAVELNGWMIKPTLFDSTKHYPVLMYVYGGPNSQEVKNAYPRSMDFAWYQLLAQKGYIIVCVDGRGTAGRGDLFKKIVYKDMGKYEASDQIAAANYLKTLSFVDSDRIGIWGWSFGGYLSALATFKSGSLFKMAVSVAPVTNWRYYDNIYTERFLQTPQENPDGYDLNSPITFASQLKANYLLIHGTADDNVHFQNSMDLVTALNEAGVQYDQFFYPNKNHFILGKNTRSHLYEKMTRYILNNL